MTRCLCPTCEPERYIGVPGFEDKYALDPVVAQWQYEDELALSATVSLRDGREVQIIDADLQDEDGDFQIQIGLETWSRCEGRLAFDWQDWGQIIAGVNRYRKVRN